MRNCFDFVVAAAEPSKPKCTASRARRTKKVLRQTLKDVIVLDHQPKREGVGG
jgi:hypothetical protein